MTTYGFKAMNMDMTCMGFQFEVGKTYKVDNDKPLELCSDSGFHFCEKFEDVFEFYKWNNCRVFKVETNSPVVTDGEKSITKEITIVSELTRDDLEYENLDSSASKNYYEIMLEDDVEFIFNTFKDNSSYGVKAAVINKMNNEGLIYKTFKDDVAFDVRVAVINKMSDEDLIYKTFKDDEDLRVRTAVVQKITDEKLIFETFKDDVSVLVRTNVLVKLSDENLVYKTFKDDSSYDIRWSVVNKLTDEKLIFETFKNDSSWVVRAAVVNKLTDPEMIKHFENDRDRYVRETAQSKLKNK